MGATTQRYPDSSGCSWSRRSDYFRASINGQFPNYYSAYEVFIHEELEINKLSELTGKPPLFKVTYDDDNRLLLPGVRQVRNGFPR